MSLLTQSKEARRPDKSIGNSGNGEDSGSSGNAKMKKLLQQLQGDAEIYFRVQGTRPEIRVDLAQLCMDGHTIHFFKALMDDDEHLTWEKLKEALLERYGGMGEGSVFEQLSALRQEGAVEDYIQSFEGLVAQVPKMPDEQYMGYFIHGLKEGIKGRVRTLKAIGPISRPRLMNLARAMEMELQEKRVAVFWAARVRRVDPV